MESFLGYVGGKRLLVKQLVEMIPVHNTYIEVFMGAAWLFFAKERSRVEVINDINKDLVSLYRVIQSNFKEFCDGFKWILTSRDQYERFHDQDPNTLTDIERAIRIYYLIKNSYGCKVADNNFTSSILRRPRYDPTTIEKDLIDIHKRLANVWIENLPYERVIEKFDDKNSFFYVDPPYYNGETNYGKGIFSKSDWTKLRDILLDVRGKFLLSINDTPEIRELFKDFTVKEVAFNYSLQKGERPKVQELLYYNYENKNNLYGRMF